MARYPAPAEPAHPDGFPDEAPTPEEAWLDLVVRAAPLDLPEGELIVVAPHPDDETLAVGGLLATAAHRGVAITVLAVTDGEASHPAVPDLAAIRREEQEAALLRLGIEDPPVRLGVPDGEVEAHQDEVADALAELIAGCEGRPTVLAPWERDGHPDHDAAGRAAMDATDRCLVPLLRYPVWAWQWADRKDLADLPLRRVTLDEDARHRKALAVACFASQTDDSTGPPILPPPVLERFARPWDVVIDHA